MQEKQRKNRRLRKFGSIGKRFVIADLLIYWLRRISSAGAFLALDHRSTCCAQPCLAPGYGGIMDIRLFTLVVCLATAGCSGYSPPKVDQDTGLYVIEESVDGESIATRDTNVDLKKYRFFWIVTQSGLLPERFEFLGREALALSGVKYVLDTRELTNFVKMTP